MLLKTHDVLWNWGVLAKDFLAGVWGTAEKYTVELRNDCPRDQLRLNDGLSKILGDIQKAVVFFDGQRLFIHQI
jgi:hypothetical protein